MASSKFSVMENYHKYLNVTEFDKKWGFYITTAGSAKVKPHGKYPPSSEHPAEYMFNWEKGRILNHYSILYITGGEGIIEYEGSRSARLSAGSCFILKPGVWHRYKPDLLTGWKEYWVSFHGVYPDIIMANNLMCDGNLHINLGHNQELLRLFHSLIKTMADAEPGYHQVIIGITLQIMAVVNNACKFRISDKYPQEKLVAKAKFLMQEAIEKPLDVRELAKELPMSYAQFRKVFREATGTSPNQYYLKLRVDKAKELLLTSELTVNEVAFKTGFTSIFYFSRFFKKITGVAPKFFRSQPKV